MCVLPLDRGLIEQDVEVDQHGVRLDVIAVVGAEDLDLIERHAAVRVMPGQPPDRLLATPAKHAPPSPAVEEMCPLQDSQGAFEPRALTAPMAARVREVAGLRAGWSSGHEDEREHPEGDEEVVGNAFRGRSGGFGKTLHRGLHGKSGVLGSPSWPREPTPSKGKAASSAPNCGSSAMRKEFPTASPDQAGTQKGPVTDSLGGENPQCGEVS